LIWTAVLCDEAGRLRAPLDAKRMQRLANALVDRMRGDSELRRNLFGRKMLVDEAQAIELTLGQLRDPRPDHVLS
jgi:hypothetical protein